MKVRECFDRVRAIPGIPTTEEEMLSVWLNECEGKVFLDILAGREGAPLTEFSGYGEDDTEETLVAPEPYAMLYVYYVAAQIYLSLADIARYNVYIGLFMDEYEEFSSYWVRGHRQTDDVRVRL